MKILLTGAAGQLGQELQPLLSKMGQVIAVDRAFSGPKTADRMEQDLGDLNRVEILLNRLHPDLVVNACAYTAVDAAETEGIVQSPRICSFSGYGHNSVKLTVADRSRPTGDF